MASVNKPTDVKKKDADVSRKLQLYGIFSAFQLGKAPSNEQIDVALNSFLASKAISSPPEKLSDEGKALVADVRDVVTQAKYLLLSKNEGNVLQDFIWQTQQFDPKSVSVPGAPLDQETAKKHGDQALQGLRTLGTLLVTNGQFRKLLSDATVLLRDMAGDAATSAASKVRPSEEQLSQIDSAAADNTWHDAPDFSKESLKKQMESVYKGSPAADIKAAVNAGNAAARPNGKEGEVDRQAGIAAAKAAMTKSLNDNVDPETKENIRQRNAEYRRRAREYFDKKMPQERKDQTVWRLKKMVLECQHHPDYQQAVETLLNLAEEYGGHGRTVAAGGADTAKAARQGLAAAEYDLKTLIERFANGTSTDGLWSSINQIYLDAEKDEELKDWFKKIDSYVRKCLLDKGYILDSASDKDWNRLYDQGRFLLREKYRLHTDRVVDEAKFLADQFDQDPQNKAFGLSVQKLFTDLGNDQDGKPTFKPHLVKDLTQIILPAVMRNVAYIPVPRIEFSDNQFDAVIENLVLESDNFMPNILEVSSEHFFSWGRAGAKSKKNKQAIDVKVSGVQMDLRDVSYHIKRKTGFPSLTDTGVASIMLAGDGFSFKVKMSTADEKDTAHFFKIDKVDVNVKHLSIKIHKSKHKLLFSIAKPIMLKVLRPALQKVAEKALKDQIRTLDALLFEIKKEADRALEEARASPEQAPNIYKRYYTAAQKRMLQGKAAAADAVADKKVNMAMTKEDSIFPNINLPGGISTEATRYKEMAREGDKWESPVFSVGKAAKSSDIPAAPKVERKAHGTAVTNGSTMSGTTVGAH